MKKISEELQSCLSTIIQKNRSVKDILQLIYDHDGHVLLVGGAVRDLFLGNDITDLDFEVYGVSLQLLESVLKKFGTVSLIGKSFGVLRVYGLDIDWSLPRTDSSGRHPKVACDPYMNYKEAFRRRDLTINAMGISMKTFELIDPFGGLQDLENKKLKAPDLEFFAQDPLRLLRVMQFVGRFEMEVDVQLSEKCKKISLKDIAIERIGKEFHKLFTQSKRPSLGLQWLHEINHMQILMPGVLPTLSLFHALDALVELIESKEDRYILMLVVIGLHEQNTLQQDNLSFQKITKEQRYALQEIMKFHMVVKGAADRAAKLVWYTKMCMKLRSDVEITWISYWLGFDDSIQTITILLRALGLDKQAYAVKLQAEKLGVYTQAVEPLLTGADFLDVAQGEMIGVLVRRALQLQIQNYITDASYLKMLVCQDVL